MATTTIADSMVETRRRQRATVTGGESTLDDASGYTRAFKADDQHIMLWNIANSNLSPRSTFPAFRLLGLFPDTDTATAHAEQIMSVDKTCSLRMATTHEWYSIPTSEIVDMAAHTAKANRNLLRHQEMLQNHAGEFKERHDALTEGYTPAIEQAQDAKAQAERDEVEREKRTAIYKSAVDGDDADIERLKAKFASEMAQGAESEIEAQTLLRLRDEAVAKTKAVTAAQIARLEQQFSDEVQTRADADDAEAARRAADETRALEEGVEESKAEPAPPAKPYVETPLVPPVQPESMNADWDDKVKALGLAIALVVISG